jgi:HD-like signal output (HDOD) protein
MTTLDKKFLPPKKNVIHKVGGFEHGVEEDVAAEVKRDIERKLNASELEAPTLPHVAHKILQVSNDPAVGMEEIQTIVQGEPFIAGKVLSLVNSAFYSGRQRVGSLKQALVFLGLKTLRDIIFSVSLHQKIFKAKRYANLMEENWAHSIGSATACGLIAEHLKVEKESAFLCGLLHDIGRSVLIHSIVGIEDTTLGGREIGADSVAVLVDDFHELVGGYVAVKWKLPPNMVESIKLHHHPERSREHRVLTSIVYCSDRIAKHIGFTGEPVECDFQLDRVFNDLKIADEETITPIVESVREQGSGFLNAFSA